MDGVILVDKPAGKTSHDVVAAVRRDRGGRRAAKVGHAGTLDPFATGLLLVLVGAATRMQRFLMALPKTYRTVARLGWTSDTGDRDGTLTETGRIPEVLHLPKGDLMQRPPAYSAVKVGGERLYKKARRGEEVEVPPRPVTVYRFEELWRKDDRVGLEVECSAGTYVRSLVQDLGDAYCEELERTAIGHFRLEDADPTRLIPLNEALSFLPEHQLSAEEANRVRNGVSVPHAADCQLPTADPFIRLTHGDELLAIAEPRDTNLKPVVVFAE